MPNQKTNFAEAAFTRNNAIEYQQLKLVCIQNADGGQVQKQELNITSGSVFFSIHFTAV